MIPVGKHLAVATSAELCKSKSGNDQIAVQFKVESGETITWYGSFSDKAHHRTIETMALCGWDLKDWDTFTGIGSKGVQIDVRDEEYLGKSSRKIKWVNAVNTAPVLNRLAVDERISLRARMAGAVQSVAGGTPKPPIIDDDNVPF